MIELLIHLSWRSKFRRSKLMLHLVGHTNINCEDSFLYYEFSRKCVQFHSHSAYGTTSFLLENVFLYEGCLLGYKRDLFSEKYPSIIRL